MGLLEFVKTKMRMSHLYQPVMIKALLWNNGELSGEEIAKEILNYDISQVEYYKNITNNMVGKVLRNHKIVQKNKSSYELVGYSTMTQQEIREIVSECDKKIEEYIEKRGANIWQHRRRNRKPVSGSIRYKVLKRARYRCELCGVSAEEKALEVDHITPKNTGGEDSINNYQALCYTCNAQKKDLDNTDFRGLNTTYDERENGCVFCNPNRDIHYENNLAVAFFDLFPVTEGHVLIVPKRHVKNYFDLYQSEINAVNQIIQEAKADLIQIDSSISGFNLGTNIGTDSGQTIFHCHIHMIPRRRNDIDDPTGGVRNVIPEKGNYKKTRNNNVQM